MSRLLLLSLLVTAASLTAPARSGAGMHRRRHLLLAGGRRRLRLRRGDGQPHDLGRRHRRTSPRSRCSPPSGAISGFYNTNALTSLDGLSGLTSVGSSLGIGATTTRSRRSPASPGLPPSGATSSLEQTTRSRRSTGLENITSLIGVEIFQNAALTSLDGLPRITSFEGSLKIRENGALTSLDGLSGTHLRRGRPRHPQQRLRSRRSTASPGSTSVGGTLPNHRGNACAHVARRPLRDSTSVGTSLSIGG